MCIACWILKAISRLRICNNYWFSTTQYLHQRASMLSYTCLPVLLFARVERVIDRLMNWQWEKKTSVCSVRLFWDINSILRTEEVIDAVQLLCPQELCDLPPYLRSTRVIPPLCLGHIIISRLSVRHTYLASTRCLSSLACQFSHIIWLFPDT